MRQKNIHGYPLMVPSIGQTVYPGEIVEHDYPLPGFEGTDAEPEQDSVPEGPADDSASSAVPASDHAPADDAPAISPASDDTAEVTP